jgi:hypothetical protein
MRKRHRNPSQAKPGRLKKRGQQLPITLLTTLARAKASSPFGRRPYGAEASLHRASEAKSMPREPAIALDSAKLDAAITLSVAFSISKREPLAIRLSAGALSPGAIASLFRFLTGRAPVALYVDQGFERHAHVLNEICMSHGVQLLYTRIAWVDFFMSGIASDPMIRTLPLNNWLSALLTDDRLSLQVDFGDHHGF